VAAKLGVIRELLRRRALPGGGVRRLPDAWDEGVAHEVAAELGISLQAADKLISLAWTLEARLPRVSAALDAGVIDYVKGSWSFAPWFASQVQEAAPAGKPLGRLRPGAS